MNKTSIKTALVTGAGKRIGSAIALDLAKQGYSVAVHYNASEEDAQNTVQEIKRAGGTAYAVQANLNDEAQASGLIEKAVKQLQAPLTTLVNNASLYKKDTIHSLDADNWYAHHRVNFLAPVLLSQAFAKALPADQTGNVINIIDQRVWKLNPQYMSYTTSKAGLWTVTQTMAQALAPLIRVNAIGPGPTLQSIHQNEETFTEETSNVLLGRGPQLQEICNTVRFLLETPSVTGQMIAVDGGQHLAWQTPDIEKS